MHPVVSKKHQVVSGRNDLLQDIHHDVAGKTSKKNDVHFYSNHSSRKANDGKAIIGITKDNLNYGQITFK